MIDQTTTPADAGGNAATGLAGPDGFIDFDTLTPETAPADEVDDGEDEGAQPEAKAEEKPEAKPEEEEKKRLSGNQRAKQQRQQLLDQIAERDRRIAELSKGKEPAADAGPKAPKEEDFNGDWFAYQRALTAFEAGESARKAAADILKSSEERSRTERAAKEANDRRDAHLDRVEKAREVIADFDAVMEGMKEVQVRDATIHEIMSSDKSELIAYHFATNPNDLHAFDAMTPREQAREIGRLEATLKMPEPKKATSAPPPLSRPKGGATPRDQNADLNAWLDKRYGKERRK